MTDTSKPSTSWELAVPILAFAGLSVVLAPQSSADEAGFIAAIESLDHYATTCAGCAQDAINAVKNAYNRDDNSSEYYATLFAQYAAVQLCPQHQGRIGPI
ncbi:hypothetical protein [Mycobacteroides chelonae]|uniref:hypothetical protein n=1 Tax=Mycobacteroides chelonae TaxID=1774 RepID=UPI0008A93CBF|nr:hypothetical protein [Mycobacteroides chelonae]OHU14891.1 hypothetical protein BKG75_06735 [Mycobacteroides chelonae]